MRVRVMLGTVVAGGVPHGPGAPLTIPDGEAEALMRDGTVAPIADDTPEPDEGEDQGRGDDEDDA